MIQIEWNNGYKLGLPSIDAEHKSLVDLLNLFLSASNADAPTSQLGVLLHDFIERTRTHFASEEQEMDRQNYPGFIAHKAEHDRLLSKADIFTRHHLGGGAPREMMLGTAEFLHRCLIDHIQAIDKPVKPFVMRLT